MAWAGLACRQFISDESADRCLLFGQHPSFSKSLVARAQSIAVDEIGHPQGGETRVPSSASCRASWTKSLVVEQVGDLRVDVVFEKLVDERDDFR